jgi:hypothetical protein
MAHHPLPVDARRTWHAVRNRKNKGNCEIFLREYKDLYN